MKKLPPGIIIPAGGDCYQERRTIFGGMQIDFKVVPEDTHSGLLVVENTNPGKGGPARHVHHDQDEWFYVIEGEYIIEIDNKKHSLTPGSSILAPRKIPHVWAHVGEGIGRLLVAFEPAGQMVGFFNEASRIKGHPSPAELKRLFHSHGMEMLGPPLPVDRGLNGL